MSRNATVAVFWRPPKSHLSIILREPCGLDRYLSTMTIWFVTKSRPLEHQILGTIPCRLFPSIRKKENGTRKILMPVCAQLSQFPAESFQLGHTGHNLATGTRRSYFAPGTRRDLYPPGRASFPLQKAGGGNFRCWNTQSLALIIVLVWRL